MATHRTAAGTITASELVRSSGAEWGSDLIGWVVVFDRAASTGGVARPAGYGRTETEARLDARGAAALAGVAAEDLDGDAFVVIDDDRCE
jgi:hypothetical protein